MVRWGWGSSTINRSLHQHHKKKPVVVVPDDEEQVVVDFKAILAEFLGVSFLVAFGAGSVVANGWENNELLVSFAVGMSILVISYAIYHHSGAQLNPAITLSVLLEGEIGAWQAFANFWAQFAGSVCGALMLWGRNEKILYIVRFVFIFICINSHILALLFLFFFLKELTFCADLSP